MMGTVRYDDESRRRSDPSRATRNRDTSLTGNFSPIKL